MPPQAKSFSPVAATTTKHRLKIIDRVTDLFAARSRSYSDEQISLFDDVVCRREARFDEWGNYIGRARVCRPVY